MNSSVFVGLCCAPFVQTHSCRMSERQAVLWGQFNQQTQGAGDELRRTKKKTEEVLVQLASYPLSLFRFLQDFQGFFFLFPKGLFFRSRSCSPKTDVHYSMFGRLNMWLCGASLMIENPHLTAIDKTQSTFFLPCRARRNFQTQNRMYFLQICLLKPSSRTLFFAREFCSLLTTQI